MVRWKKRGVNILKLMLVTSFSKTIRCRALLKRVLVYHGEELSKEE